MAWPRPSRVRDAFGHHLIQASLRVYYARGATGLVWGGVMECRLAPTTEKDWQEMKTLYGFSFDKLSNELGKVASSLTPEDRKTEELIRPQLISDLSGLGSSLFNLGRSLFDYRAALKMDGTWMTAAKFIADYIGLSDRSLFRLIERYEVAAKLPEPMREA